MYSRVNGLLGDIEHCIHGILEHYYQHQAIHMEHAVVAMFQILKITLRKLQDIYYQHVLRRKLERTIEHNQEMLHLTSTILISLALNMNQHSSSMRRDKQYR